MLWEVDVVCQRYGILPSKLLGFDLIFSDSICFDVDVTVAKFGQQTDSRMAAEKKKGKYGREKKHKTMSEVLGLSEDEWRGGFDQQELEDAGEMYLAAVKQAQREGKPVPDIDEWMATYDPHAENADDDIDDD